AAPASSLALRVARYEVAARIPRVELVGPATDRVGRHGVAVAYVDSKIPRAPRADLRPEDLRAARRGVRRARRQLLRLPRRHGHRLRDLRLERRREPARRAPLAHASRARRGRRSSTSSRSEWAAQFTSQTITTEPT